MADRRKLPPEHKTMVQWQNVYGVGDWGTRSQVAAQPDVVHQGAQNSRLRTQPIKLPGRQAPPSVSKLWNPGKVR